MKLQLCTFMAVLTCALFLLSGMGATGVDPDIPASHLANPPPIQKDEGKGDSFILPKLADRQSRRSFYGAPPVIPHRIGKTNRECASCHNTAKEYKGRISTPTPHPEFTSCQQCHVRGAGPDIFTKIVHLQSDWLPLSEPRLGNKSHPYAPPTLPHRLHMRENCASCHSKKHSDKVMSVKHSQRTNCMQCHVPDYKQAHSPFSQEFKD